MGNAIIGSLSVAKMQNFNAKLQTGHFAEIKAWMLNYTDDLTSTERLHIIYSSLTSPTCNLISFIEIIRNIKINKLRYMGLDEYTKQTPNQIEHTLDPAVLSEYVAKFTHLSDKLEPFNYNADKLTRKLLTVNNIHLAVVNFQIFFNTVVNH